MALIRGGALALANWDVSIRREEEPMGNMQISVKIWEIIFLAQKPTANLLEVSENLDLDGKLCNSFPYLLILRF